MANELFRREASSDEGQRCLGDVILAGPISRWPLVFLALTLTICIGVFLWFGQYSGRETVTGQVVPSSGLLNIIALSPGTVARVHVKDGQAVNAGAALIEISTEKGTLRSEAIHALINRTLDEKADRHHADLLLQIQLAHHQADALRTRASLIRQKLVLVEAQAALQRQEVEDSSALLERIKPLSGNGYVSIFEIQRQTAVVLTARSRLAELQREKIDFRSQLATDLDALAKLPLDEAGRRNSIGRELADVEKLRAENELQRGMLHRAGEDGLVSALLVKAGQMVSAGQPIMSILPERARLRAQLLVPSRAIGFISRGNRVVLRYDAFPYQKFGQQFGRVATISRSALTSAEQSALTGSLTPIDMGPVYQVDVDLDRQYVLADGLHHRIRPGMALQADVLRERRRIVEWLFEPMFGIRRRLLEVGANE